MKPVIYFHHKTWCGNICQAKTRATPYMHIDVPPPDLLRIDALLMAISSSCGWYRHVWRPRRRSMSLRTENRRVQQSVLFPCPRSVCCLIILPPCCWRTLKDRGDWIQVLNIPWKPIRKSPRIIIPVRCRDSLLFCSIFFSGFWLAQKE